MKHYLVASMLFLAAAPAFTQGAQNPAATPVETGETSNDEYWTPERLKRATPMELPRPATGGARPKAEYSMPEYRGQSLISPGRKPVLNIKPKTDPLFLPLATETSQEPLRASARRAQSQGRSTAFFTSSRVVPAPASQNYYPYRATGKLFFSDSSGRGYICSGTVISWRLIITAGHCVYDAGTNQWYKNFQFIPGYHKGNAPYGRWDWSWAITTNAWVDGGGKIPSAGDFAILEIRDKQGGRKIGNVTGWHGWFTHSANPNHLTMLGYPANFDRGEWMHRVDSQQFRDPGFNAVEYGSDMKGGSSGGPWLMNFGELSIGESLDPSGMNYVVAVTSYGPVDDLDYQGASVLDEQFSNSSKTGIFDRACAHKSGNCR